jgi:hypothetical protein
MAMGEPAESRIIPDYSVKGRYRSSFLAAAMVVAAVMTGLAIQLQNGEYTPAAMGLITVALIASVFAVGFSNINVSGEGPASQLTMALLAVGLAAQFAALFLAWPGVDLPHLGGRQLLPFQAGLSLAAGLLVLGALESSGKTRIGYFDKRGMGVPPMAFIWFPLLLIIFLLLGIWMVHSSPRPAIDVWEFQQRAAHELLHGRNPYAMTFPDIYHSTHPGHQQVYGPGLVVNDQLQFGFPYPPVSLLLATIGYAVAGDHRYAQVLAITLAATFIGYCRRGRVAMLAAALLLFTPRIFFVLGRGWTEPFVVMLLAATIFCACRRSRWLPVALGLFLATKQYLIFALPLTFFLLPPSTGSGQASVSGAESTSSIATGFPRSIPWRDWFSLLWKSALVAAIVTLPFVFWNYHAFVKSTVTVQELSPFRWDALSYLVWYGFRGHLVTQPLTAVFWSTFAATAALVWSLWRAPRTPAGFAAALALLSLAFFAFNKQAFCNYYFFVIGAMCCAIAASNLSAD